MKGQILDFSLQNSSGIINGEDGNRYSFDASEWKEQGMPTRGMAVDFAVNVEGKAEGIYRTLPNKPTARVVSSNTNFSEQSENEFSVMLNFALSCFKRYADFNGRAQRKEYWSFILFWFVAQFVLGMISEILNISYDNVNMLLGLFFLGTALPQWAVTARRLHDIGKSGWWQLIVLIPLAGIIWLIVLLCKDGDPDTNQYGENPKAV